MQEQGSLVDERPRWRGRLHAIAFLVSIPAGVAVVAAARSPAARIAAVVYALSLSGLYASSSAYHRRQWSPKALRRMKRLDHSMIFVLIAGTYTPLAVLVLRPPWSVAVLATVWGGAFAGIVLKFLRVDGLKVATGVLYIALGWLAVFAAPQLVRHLSAAALVLLAVGGILYTSGAAVLARRRPNPSPRVFGYHEIWHSFVVAASACHYVAVFGVVAGAR